MADVTVISSTIVRPGNTNQSNRSKIHLNLFDYNLLYVDYPQIGLLFHKPNLETHFISRLEISLSTALEIFFHFAGRIVKVENLEDRTMSFFIDCDDSSGARFIHAESKTSSVSDILLPHGDVPDFMSHFFPVMDLKSCDGVSEPLLHIQVTEIKDGVFISFCYNHLVADGVSMWDFFHTWSKICSNGSDSDHLQPLVLKGWFLDGIDYPMQIPIPETKMTPPPLSTEVTSAPINKEKVFHFTKKNISDLKAKANSEVITSSSTDIKISSLQAVSAHMLRSIIRHSGLSREKEMHCKVAVDLRQRLNPPVRKECFGNMAHLAPATVTMGELLDRGLGWAALQISKSVRSQTNENSITFAEDWVKNVKLLQLGVGSKTAGDSILISGSPRFQVYNNDFGWGKPISVRSGPGNSMNGKLVFFPGAEDDETIDIHATLWSHVLVNLLAGAKFLEHVTITP